MTHFFEHTLLFLLQGGKEHARINALKTCNNLMSDNIESQVKEIIAAQLSVDPEKVTTDAKFIEDLGADSLDTVELVMAFEDKFSVEVPDEDAEKLKSVADVVAYIESHKG